MVLPLGIRKEVRIYKKFIPQFNCIDIAGHVRDCYCLKKD